MDRTSKVHTMGQREKLEEAMGSQGATDLELLMVLRGGTANVKATVQTLVHAVQKVGNGMQGGGPWGKMFLRPARIESMV